MTTSKQQTIRARIADEAIAKVMQFFDGTLAQALHEILQNARRSGAMSAAITHDHPSRRIAVSDDGRGIGDPRTLLAFGRSGWPKDLHGAEHPACMGIFSLARRSPRIRSRVAGAHRLERPARGGPRRRTRARGRRGGPRLGPRPRHRRDVLRPADRQVLDPGRDHGGRAALPDPGIHQRTGARDRWFRERLTAKVRQRSICCQRPSKSDQ